MMEMKEGAKVAKGKLTEDLARKFFHQLVSAVNFCHGHGVSHQDFEDNFDDL